MPVTGLESVLSRLRSVADRVPHVAAEALRAEAEIEMTEAKRRTPVDTGALRASGHVSDPEIDGKNISVSLGFGGPAADYAFYVHEDLDAFHPVGQAKYLESVLDESRPHLAKRVASRIDLQELVR